MGTELIQDEHPLEHAETLGKRPRRRDRIGRTVWKRRNTRALEQASALITVARQLDVRLAERRLDPKGVYIPTVLRKARWLVIRRRAIPAFSHLMYWEAVQELEFGVGPATAAIRSALNLDAPVPQTAKPRSTVDPQLMGELDIISSQIVGAFHLQGRRPESVDGIRKLANKRANEARPGPV